jgi:hypothetical protein
MTLLAGWLGGVLKALGALGIVSLGAAACALLVFLVGRVSGAATPLIRAARD